MTAPTLPSSGAIDPETSRYEFVGGCVVERPLPNESHVFVAGAVIAALFAPAVKLGFRVGPEWTIDRNGRPDHEWLIPDIVAASDHYVRTKNGQLLSAFLAIEVLSPGQTYREVHKEKVLTYFAWNAVEHVWLIDPGEQSAMVFGKDTPSMGMTIFEGTLQAGELQIDLADIFNFQQ